MGSSWPKGKPRKVEICGLQFRIFRHMGSVIELIHSECTRKNWWASESNICVTAWGEFKYELSVRGGVTIFCNMSSMGTLGQEYSSWCGERELLSSMDKMQPATEKRPSL